MSLLDVLWNLFFVLESLVTPASLALEAFSLSSREVIIKVLKSKVQRCIPANEGMIDCVPVRK